MRRSRVVALVVVAAAVVAAGAIAWRGANAPDESWFGQMVSHGPRAAGEVALTFDDGPNVQATPAIASILDRHGVKGTFFVVGKAMAARPDVVRQLVADGQLVANHSYRHDSRGWLNPWYPELGQTQRTFARDVGV